MKLADTWLERAFAGSVVGRDEVTEDNPRDSFLRSLGIGSALMVPLVIDGKVENAIALHFSSTDAFDEIDMVMLRSVASHVGLALANVQLYDLERCAARAPNRWSASCACCAIRRRWKKCCSFSPSRFRTKSKLTCAVYEFESVAARCAARCAGWIRRATVLPNAST